MSKALSKPLDLGVWVASLWYHPTGLKMKWIEARKVDRFDSQSVEDFIIDTSIWAYRLNYSEIKMEPLMSTLEQWLREPRGIINGDSLVA